MYSDHRARWRLQEQGPQNLFSPVKHPSAEGNKCVCRSWKNHPVGQPNSADGEVDLDIEVAGAIASGAHSVVYFAPNTDRGFLDAITQAIHDTTNQPSVTRISG